MDSKKVYIKRLLAISLVFIGLQIFLTYLAYMIQLDLDDLNQLETNCNLKQSIITVVKKSVPNTTDTDFKECSIINPDDPTYTAIQLKSDQTSKKHQLLIYTSINWILSIFNTISMGLLTAIVLIPSNEPLFTI